MSFLPFLPSPFFSEEFYFEIPRTFQYLSFYVYDKNVLQRDLRIGMYYSQLSLISIGVCIHSFSKYKMLTTTIKYAQHF